MSENEEEWYVSQEQVFNTIVLPDVCIFTGSAMDYGQLPLTSDAAQRAANHFYLEEEIARYERMLSDQSSVSTVGSFDPVSIQVMSSLQPDYVFRLQAAINFGLDEDAVGVLTYVSSDDEEVVANDAAPDSDSAADDDEPPVIHRELPLPDAGLTSVTTTLDDIRLDPHKWVLDTGASTSSCKHACGVIKERKVVSKEVVTSAGDKIAIVRQFDLQGTFMSHSITPVATIILRGVNYAPRSAFNLFSVAQSLKDGWQLHGDYKGLRLTKNGQEIYFNTRVRAGTGYLWCARIVPMRDPLGSPDVSAMSLALTQNVNNSKKSMETLTIPSPPSAAILCSTRNSTVVASAGAPQHKCDGVTHEYVHVLYGHVHLRKALQMAKYFGLSICTKGDWCKKVLACEACALGKARKIGVNISGTSTHIRAVEANKFVYLDLSTIREAGGIAVPNGVWV